MSYIEKKEKTKLCTHSPRANYTTERPPLVGEVIANFCGYRVSCGLSTDPYGHTLGFLDRTF
jgi:hypothetical protein